MIRMVISQNKKQNCEQMMSCFQRVMSKAQAGFFLSFFSLNSKLPSVVLTLALLSTAIIMKLNMSPRQLYTGLRKLCVQTRESVGTSTSKRKNVHIEGEFHLGTN